MTRDIWVTGGHGFIGRHVSLLASRQGQRICGIGHGAWPEIERQEFGVGEWLNGDVCQGNLDVLATRGRVPDTIIHLAGGSSVGPSLVAPAEDFRRTVVATSSLLEWVRLRCPDTKVVLASSAAVYGSGHTGPIGRNAECTPYSPYGNHKLMAELLLRGYGRDFGICGSVVRLFSVYGPGLKKQLLWDLCGKLNAGNSEVVLGGIGTEVRDWLHVVDAGELILQSASFASPSCPTMNGGSGVSVTVRQIASWASMLWGGGQSVRFNGVCRAGDPASLVADISVQPVGLAWEPKISWMDGAKAYIDWYRIVHGVRER